MSSPVARPIRSSSKKLTSSTLFQSVLRPAGSWGGRTALVVDRPAVRLDLLDRGGLPATEVDAELLGCPEDVLVAVLHLDGDAVAGEHLDIEAQRLQLL